MKKKLLLLLLIGITVTPRAHTSMPTWCKVNAAIGSVALTSAVIIALKCLSKGKRATSKDLAYKVAHVHPAQAAKSIKDIFKKDWLLGLAIVVELACLACIPASVIWLVIELNNQKKITEVKGRSNGSYSSFDNIDENSDDVINVNLTTNLHNNPEVVMNKSLFFYLQDNDSKPVSATIGEIVKLLEKGAIPNSSDLNQKTQE